MILQNFKFASSIWSGSYLFIWLHFTDLSQPLIISLTCYFLSSKAYLELLKVCLGKAALFTFNITKILAKIYSQNNTWSKDLYFHWSQSAKFDKMSLYRGRKANLTIFNGSMKIKHGGSLAMNHRIWGSFNTISLMILQIVMAI